MYTERAQGTYHSCMTSGTFDANVCCACFMLYRLQNLFPSSADLFSSPAMPGFFSDTPIPHKPNACLMQDCSQEAHHLSAQTRESFETSQFSSMASELPRTALASQQSYGTFCQKNVSDIGRKKVDRQRQMTGAKLCPISKS